MSEFVNDRKMLVAWIKKYAPQGSPDQAMALIEGKSSHLWFLSKTKASNIPTNRNCGLESFCFDFNWLEKWFKDFELCEELGIVTSLDLRQQM